jgi:Family of unknown function (DUF6941)
MSVTNDRVRLEWLILADGAQVAGGKLYLLGGGWDVLTVNAEFPVNQHLAIAAAFRVPWTATNQQHTFELKIVNDDTGEIVAGFGGQFETGRPPGLPPGTSQLSQLTAEAMVQFKTAGLFTVRAAIDSQEQADRHFPFRVVEGPMLAMKRSGQQGPS